jgi:hypothetical protein
MILELSPVTPMKGAFPKDIPFAPGLNPDDFMVEEVTGYREQDGQQIPITVQQKPTFVTLQIAEVGRISEKGILYDEALVNTIEEQINRKRPGGIFGHVDPTRPYDMPDPEVMWVGAKREGNTLWAKGWVREPKSARRVKDIMRVGGTLGTSIWGVPASRVVENQSVRLKDFNLHRLDLADDVERASLQLGGAFRVTAEMNTNSEQEEIVDTKTVSEFLKTLKPAQILELLGDQKAPVTELIVNAAELSATAQAVAELLGERDAAQAQVAELNTQLEAANTLVAEFQSKKNESEIRSAIKQATPWNVTTESGRALYNAMHNDLLYPAVVEEMAAGKNLGAAIATVMEMKKVSVDSYKKSIAGNGLAAGSDNRIQMFGTEFTPDQIERAKNETGIRF